MKKYITTDKHPELKEGIEFKQSLTRTDMYISSRDRAYISHYDMVNEVRDGYIKEVEEKLYTKSDMLEFALDWYPHSIHSKAETVKVFFNIWIKEKNEL